MGVLSGISDTSERAWIIVQLYKTGRPLGRRYPVVGDLRLLSLSCPAHKISEHVPSDLDFMSVKLFKRKLDLCVSAKAAVDISDERTWEKNLPSGTYLLQEYGGQGLFCGDNDTLELDYFSGRLRAALSGAALRTRHKRLVDAVKSLLSDQCVFDASSMIEATRFFSETTLYLLLLQTFELDVRSARSLARSLIPGIQALLADVSSRVFCSRIPYAGTWLGDQSRALRYPQVKVVQDFIANQVAVQLDSPPNRLESISQFYIFDDDLKVDATVSRKAKEKQLLTLLVAGFETTGNAIAFALRDILCNPSWLSWVRSGLSDDFSLTEGCPTFDVTRRLKRIEACFLESLRLHPTAPAYHRKKRTNATINNPGAPEEVTVLLEPVLKDSTAWGLGAESYNPKRFIDSKVPAAYKPFGTGRRACVGRHLAIYEAQLVLGFLLYNYAIRPESGLGGVRERLTAAPARYWVSLKRNGVA